MHTKKLCIIERIDSAFTCNKYMYPLICFCTAFYLISFTRRSDLILFFFQSILELPAFFFDKNDINHYTKYFFSRQIFTKFKKWKKMQSSIFVKRNEKLVITFVLHKFQKMQLSDSVRISEPQSSWIEKKFGWSKSQVGKKLFISQKNVKMFFLC